MNLFSLLSNQDSLTKAQVLSPSTAQEFIRLPPVSLGQRAAGCHYTMAGFRVGLPLIPEFIKNGPIPPGKVRAAQIKGARVKQE